ncbi:hypothetical protein MMC13_007108 [Lambiella insularis]|nr:hypothetical protein [Lambiella insularis]
MLLRYATSLSGLQVFRSLVYPAKVLNKNASIIRNTAFYTSLTQKPVCSPFKEIDKEPTKSLTDQVREAMRKVPHPLTVITANSSDGGLTGLLVSSFNTITIHPEPMVSFNIKLPSSTYEEIARTGSFTATFIDSVQTAESFLKRKIGSSNPSIEPMIGSQMQTGLLRGRIFSFECEWMQEKSPQVGDHVIMVGRVTDCAIPPTSESPRWPLMYRDGKYVDGALLMPAKNK